MSTEELQELKGTFNILWGAYVDEDIENLAPSGIRMREELIAYVKALDQGGMPFTKLQAELREKDITISDLEDRIKTPYLALIP